MPQKQEIAGASASADRAFALRAEPVVSAASQLQSLARRCEEAEGPDRELDIAILVALDWREPDWEEGERTAKEMADRHGLAWLTTRSVDGYSSTWRHLPRLTASLDATMTLVPEGLAWVIGIDVTGKHFANVDFAARHEGATPALALCAAALKARALAGIETGTAETVKQGTVPKG